MLNVQLSGQQTFFHQEQESKYFQLCRSDSLCCNFPCGTKSAVDDTWPWLCPNKTLFMRPVGRLDLAHRHSLPTLTSAHLFPAILYDEETERLLGEILCPT